MSEDGSKRVVVYGTGFVGRMVIAEIVKHPLFELVGVGVSNPNKVGRDVGDICGLPEQVGILATDDIDALIALKPDALVHYGPTAMHAKENIALITPFPAGRHRRLFDGDDAVGVADDAPESAELDRAHHPSLRAGRVVLLHHRHRPGFANDLFPMTLMGLCSEVRRVRASELLDYTNYEGDYEFEMGIGREPEYKPMLEDRDMLIFAWGATVPMIAHAAGIMLDEMTTTWDKWVTPTERNSARGVIKPGHVAAVRFTINGIYKGETRIQLEHVNRIGHDAAPDWPSGHDDDVYRVDIEGTPSIFQETAFRFTDGSGRDAATAGCLSTGLRALNAVPAVNDLPPGWVTPLDLPLIAGAGNIR